MKTDVETAIAELLCCKARPSAVFVLAVFMAGALFGGLLAWHAMATTASTEARAMAGAATDVSCPAPVIDTDRLAQVCMDWHHKKSK